tara:strand:+ start:209 stop:601 length:393 start_codon:yes stop_codon:yes gene_type:complete
MSNSETITNYTANKVLGVLRNTAFAGISAVYVGFVNADPTRAGTGGTEITTTIRSAGRIAVSFDAPVSGVMTNTAKIDFGASAGTTTIRAIGVYDAASGGNLLFYKNIPSLSVSAGQNVIIKKGTLRLGF